MSAKLVLGSSRPVETSRNVSVSGGNTAVVEVEGSYARLEAAAPEQYVPSGYTYDSHTLSSHGNGMGKMMVRCIKFDVGASFTAARTTFEVDMSEVTYDLYTHPYLDEVRDVCTKWIDDGCIAHDGTFYTKNAEGEEEEVEDAAAWDFCYSYAAGIHSYVRYFPVVTKVSVYKNPPGLSMSGNSFSGGSLPFSNDIGKFSAPPITLNGVAASNFFKSADRWAEAENKTWTRTEQWTYTPNGPDGAHGWIYG